MVVIGRVFSLQGGDRGRDPVCVVCVCGVCVCGLGWRNSLCSINACRVVTGVIGGPVRNESLEPHLARAVDIQSSLILFLG